MNSRAGDMIDAVVLIVADVSADRLFLSEILVHQGYEVYALLPGDVTELAVAELSPDLVVLDDEPRIFMAAFTPRFLVPAIEAFPERFETVAEVPGSYARVLRVVR